MFMHLFYINLFRPINLDR